MANCRHTIRVSGECVINLLKWLDGIGKEYANPSKDFLVLFDRESRGPVVMRNIIKVTASNIVVSGQCVTYDSESRGVYSILKQLSQLGDCGHTFCFTLYNSMGGKTFRYDGDGSDRVLECPTPKFIK